jgi:hypothetical protein
MFMSHVAFVIEYPGGSRMMFGELQHARATPAKQAAYTLMRRYAERVSTKLEEGNVTGEISSDTDRPPAAILFIGIDCHTLDDLWRVQVGTCQRR